MKIYPVNINQKNYVNPNATKNVSVPKRQPAQTNLSFNGKYSSTKFWGGIFGTVATVSAATFAIATSGGLAAIPFVLGYGAIGAGTGLAVGYTIDKGVEDFEKSEKKQI